MRNFLISSAANIVLIFASYFVFKGIISGPTRHRLYENFFGSFAKFIIYLFIITVLITGLTAFALYKTRFIAYVNVVAPALVSILVGFVMSTVPTRGSGDKNNNKNKG
ncbi:hypothetical protein [Clostridium lundense]|uniref:hypothetical protein n=1 Tax=Clostridium lundense TaxID=319475 RepID=UPI000486D153|nr:hypothetical protein [Clostridium lundense]